MIDFIFVVNKTQDCLGKLMKSGGEKGKKAYRRRQQPRTAFYLDSTVGALENEWEGRPCYPGKMQFWTSLPATRPPS